MPKKGERATECKRGHDLTAPDARMAPPKNGRGGGVCRLCVVELNRVRRGSTKTGPPSRYKGDETARLAAVEQGLKRCPRCEEAKPLDAYWVDKRTPDGRGVYCASCAREANRAHYLANRDAILLKNRAKKFDITAERLSEMLDEQQGLCAICRRTCATRRALAVDHDHTTGKVRALLCAKCNQAIGLLNDSPDLVIRVADYLTRWKSDGETGVHRVRLSSTD